MLCNVQCLTVNHIRLCHLNFRMIRIMRMRTCHAIGAAVISVERVSSDDSDVHVNTMRDQR